MKTHVFLLLLCSGCFSNELKVGLVDSDFSYRMLEQKHVRLMQLDTNDSCRLATKKVQLDQIFCLNILNKSNLASKYDAHGDDVAKNYLLERNTHELIAVDITKHADPTVFDVSMIAAYLLSETGVDIIIATTKVGTSYSAPKLTGKILNLAVSCQLDLKTTMGMVRKLSKATDLDYQPIAEAQLNPKDCD